MTKSSSPHLRALGWLAGTFVLWVVAMSVARRLLDHHPPAVPVRASIVVLAVGAFLAFAVAMIRFIGTLDEFSRRVQLIAVAVAFVVTSAAILAGDLLQSAGFLGDVPLEAIWMFTLVVWWLSIIAVSRYYR
jgi:hypothetical protein